MVAEELGYETRVANTSLDATDLYVAFQPDVVILDMIMPEMDGLELTQKIRDQYPDKTAKMPILALTANTNPVDRDKCLAAGMSEVLHKPMDTLVLVRTVGQQVRRSRQEAP